jgi:hypothetical protein
MKLTVVLVITLVLVTSTARGTTITHLMSKDGMVFCADRRVLVNGKPSDFLTKLRLLGTRAGFACAGTTRHLSPMGRYPEFDAYTVVSQFVAEHRLGDFRSFLPQLGDFLMRRFDDTVTGMLRIGEPLPPEDPDHIHFRVLVFRMTENHMPEMGMVQVTYMIGPNLFINNGYGSIDGSEFETSQFFVLGSGGKVAEELKSGHDKKYDELRSLPVVRRYLAGKQELSKVDRFTAEKASRSLIRIISQHVRDFEGVDDVSPDCNCLLVPFRGDAKWLDQ